MARVSTSWSAHDERGVRARRKPLLPVQQHCHPGMSVTRRHLACLARAHTAGVPRWATHQPASAVTPCAHSECSVSSADMALGLSFRSFTEPVCPTGIHTVVATVNRGDGLLAPRSWLPESSTSLQMTPQADQSSNCGDGCNPRGWRGRGVCGKGSSGNPGGLPCGSAP